MIVFFIFMLIANGVNAQDNSQLQESVLDMMSKLDQIVDPFTIKVPEPVIQINPNQQDGVGNIKGVVDVNQWSANMTNQVPEAIKPQKPNLSVEGLVWGDKIQQAIINGHVVGVGDKVNDVEIKSVTKEGVTVSYKNFDFVLTVP